MYENALKLEIKGLVGKDVIAEDGVDDVESNEVDAAVDNDVIAADGVAEDVSSTPNTPKRDAGK